MTSSQHPTSDCHSEEDETDRFEQLKEAREEEREPRFPSLTLRTCDTPTSSGLPTCLQPWGFPPTPRLDPVAADAAKENITWLPLSSR